MREFSFMIKPASSLCNLKCTYCFNEDIASNRCTKSYGIMTEETAKNIILNIYQTLHDGDHINFIFQGGEPTLAGIEFFNSFTNFVAKQVKKVSVFYSLQTNGTLIDEAWCEFFKKHSFFIGLSIDGTKSNHNFYRADENGNGSYSQVIKTKRLLDKYDLQYNILCTLTNNLAKNPGEVWDNILKENIQFIQFIPCLKNLYDDRRDCDLTPENFYIFYKNLFVKWKNEVLKGNYISVKLFDDIVNLFLFNCPTACGICGNCKIQYVIESDGGVYPCDFYTLDAYCGGNLSKTNIKLIEKNLINTGFLNKKGDKNTICSSCKYLNFCGGGCKRITSSAFIDKNAADFCAYQKLLDEILADLCEVSKKLIDLNK